MPLLSKTLITLGLKSVKSQLGWELGVFFKHLRGLLRSRRYKGCKHLKLNLGCGRNIKKGWVNVDLSSEADLTLDLREPLHMSEGSCERVYSEHFLEHLSYPMPAISFLSECFRVLEPGGELSLGVPDTEWPLKEYAGVQDRGYFELAAEKWHPAWCQTKLEHLNFHFRDCGEHRYAYDFETLEKVLKSIGFENVAPRDFDSLLDSEDRRLGTLYVQAIKGL